MFRISNIRKQTNWKLCIFPLWWMKCYWKMLRWQHRYAAAILSKREVAEICSVGSESSRFSICCSLSLLSQLVLQFVFCRSLAPFLYNVIHLYPLRPCLLHRNVEYSIQYYVFWSECDTLIRNHEHYHYQIKHFIFVGIIELKNCRI